MLHCHSARVLATVSGWVHAVAACSSEDLGRVACQLAWHARAHGASPAPLSHCHERQRERKSTPGPLRQLKRGRACGPNRFRARRAAVIASHQALLAGPHQPDVSAPSSTQLGSSTLVNVQR